MNDLPNLAIYAATDLLEAARSLAPTEHPEHGWVVIAFHWQQR